jgi:hypothetical protein
MVAISMLPKFVEKYRFVAPLFRRLKREKFAFTVTST